jgi:group I intron endonuclease
MQRIYKITNQINGKIYIGKTILTIEKRLKRHFYLADKKINRYLYDAINKYNKENFIIELIEECEYNLANEREIYYINFYSSNNKEIGYNMTIGGDGGRMPKESLKKMILKKTGMKLSEEHKRKISEANKGRSPHPMTDVCKEKIKQSLLKSGHKPPIIYWKTEEHPMYGKIHSDKTKQKLSEFRTGKTWEEVNGKESAKINKEKMSDRFSGSNNVNYIEFDIEEHLEEILNSNNIRLLCKEKYNIVYPTLLYKFKKRYGYTITQFKKTLICKKLS